MPPKFLISLPLEFIELYHPILNFVRNSTASMTCLELPLGEIKLFLIFIEAKVLCSDSNSTQIFRRFLIFVEHF